MAAMNVTASLRPKWLLGFTRLSMSIMRRLHVIQLSTLRPTGGRPAQVTVSNFFKSPFSNLISSGRHVDEREFGSLLTSASFQNKSRGC
jgi:hypothetical protein